MDSLFSKDFWRFSLLLFLALVLGLWFERVWVFLAILFAAISFWQWMNLWQLERHLRLKQPAWAEEDSGIWGEIYNNLYRSRKRYKKRQRRLRDIITRFKTSTAAMPDATIVLTKTLVIDWINGAAKKQLGLRSSDAGQRITTLLRHPDFVRFIESDSVLQNGSLQDVVFPSPCDETRLLSAQLVPFGVNQRLLLLRDMTQIHAAEQKQREFIANASHELRTPLSVIYGYLEIINDCPEQPEDGWKKSISQMLQQAGRMRSIVEDLLFLSNLDGVSRAITETVNVAELVRCLHEEIQENHGTDHQWQLELDESVVLEGCPKELYSAFSNLMINATRYTPVDGSIVLRWYQDDKGRHFSVEDTGQGIETYHLSRLTERFYRVDAGRSKEVGGTGLGLAIVQQVLKRHQAHLSIHSMVGQGSVFCCSFPSSEKPVKK
jgi:two-component system, OmpR family, phosphate regulon sensor histidine kinase PhoR